MFFKTLKIAAILFLAAELPLDLAAQGSTLPATCQGCTITTPFPLIIPACTPTATATPTATPTVQPRCGDSIVQPELGEACDDGNTNETDGCRRCKLPTCGDGIKDVILGEQCDDGNTNVNDSCAFCMATDPCAGVAVSHKCDVPVIVEVNKAGKCPTVANTANYATYSPKVASAWCCWATSCQRGDWSFDPDTNIHLANGKTIKVTELSAGDFVLGLNGESRKVKQIVQSEEKFPMIRITAGEGNLTVTHLHIIWTTSGLKTASQIVVGDQVKNSLGVAVSVSKVETLPVDPAQNAYGVILDGSTNNRDVHLLVADGILVGDYALENEINHGVKSDE